MTAHHKSTKCTSNVRIPPTALWNTDQVVAFPNDHKFAASWPQCCGSAANITLYNKRCFRFCDIEGNNQTDVVNCLKDAGVKKAVGFNNSDSGDDEDDDEKTSGAVYDKSVSKAAVGLAVFMLAGMAVGVL